MLYADDIFIVSLSSSGLQHLLNICSDYCVRHDLTFNAKKSMCMYFSTPINKHCGLPVIYLFFFCFFKKKKKIKKKNKATFACRHVWCRGKASALLSKRHEFEPSSRHKTYTHCAVGQ